MKIKNSITSTLLDRYKNFRKKHFEDENTFSELIEHGQKPKALIVSCCDSRVDPALLTNAYPGELFIVRNIANIVPSQNQLNEDVSVAAALEYGVVDLNITDIIVLGHQHCGGIRALLESTDKPINAAAKWVSIAKPAKEKVLKEHTNTPFKQQLRLLEIESSLLSYANLETYPFIKERVLQNQLSLHAWMFNLDTGDIQVLETTER